MANKDFTVDIVEASFDLSARERIRLKDFTNAMQLDEACNENSLVITPVIYAILNVHNERSKDQKDYVKYIIIDKAGNKFITGSNSFFEAFSEIWDEMSETGEEFEIEVYKVPSKNYKGKYFLTCSII